MKRTFDPQGLMRPHLRTLVPYSSARHEHSGRADVMLDANENAHGSPIGGGLHRYPDPGRTALRGRLSKLLGIAPGQLFVGNGSDQVIDLLIRAFCEPGKDHIIVCPPTYGMYAVSAATNAVGVRAVPLRRGFRPDLPAILEAADARSKLLFLCSPNNPTGNLVDRGVIEHILGKFPGIVVVDEAYIEYSGTTGALDLLAAHPGLVVMRTLSKAWGCAGLRVGIGCASPSIVAILDMVRPPYDQSAPVQELALKALGRVADVRRSVRRTIRDRDALAAHLREMPPVMRVFPSDANFLLVRVKEPRALLRHLAAHGIIVRDRSHETGCAGCLRITVGTARENRSLLNAIRTYMP